MGQCMSGGSAGRRVGASAVAASSSSSSISSVSSLPSISSETSQSRQSNATRLSTILGNNRERKRARAEEKKRQKKIRVMKCKEARQVKLIAESKSGETTKLAGAPSPSLSSTTVVKKTFVGKSVTFSDPENQEPNSGILLSTVPDAKERQIHGILNTVGGTKKSKTVSKLKVFNFLTKKNNNLAQGGSGKRAACEDRTNKTGGDSLTKENRADVQNSPNGNFEQSDQFHPTNENTQRQLSQNTRMGVECSDGNGNFTMLVETARTHVTLHKELNYGSCAKLTNDIRSIQNNNLPCTPISSSYETDNLNCADSVRKAELIRERIRKQRDIFFNSPTVPSPSLPSSYPSTSNDSSEMKGLKPFENGHSDRRLTNGTSNGLFKSYASSSQETDKQVKDGIIPKLFSVPNGSHTEYLPPSKEVSRIPAGPASRLPMYSYSNGNGSTTKTTKKITSAVGQNGQSGKLQPYALRTAKVSKDGNPNTEWVSGNDFFQPKNVAGNLKASPIRRETLPPKFGPINILDSKNTLSSNGTGIPNRRSSGSMPLGSRLPTYNSGVKKPMESEPFYMLGLYQNRYNQVPNNVGASKQLASRNYVPGLGFPTVSTGNVKEKTQQYQSKLTEKTGINTGKYAINRSATFTKSRACMTQTTGNPSEIPPLVDGRGDGQDTRLDNYGAPQDSGVSSINSNFCHTSTSNFPSNSNFRIRAPTLFATPYIQGGTLNLTVRNPGSDHSSESSNYPITRDDSTASSVASSEERYVPGSSYVTADADKAISDSEFLIDDEISDQPELTLTFKDSPLILSPSSSGESLISCDLMLDYKDGTCSGHVSSDSTLLDEELSVIVTRREDKASQEDGILRSEDNNSNISRNMVNVSSNKSLIQTSETGHNNQTTSTVITAMSPSNKSPKVTSTTNFITGSQQNLVNANNTVNNYRLQQSPQQQSNISLRSLKSAYSSPTQLPEPNQNHHSSPKRFNEETRNRSYPPPVRPPNLSRSPCRIPNRNSQTPRTPSPVMPPSRCLKPKSHQSQEIVYSPSKPVAENRNRVSDGSVMNNFVQDILNEVTEYKVQLQQLLDVLVSVEKEGEEKDVIIQKQQMEIEFWKTKAIALENSSNDTLETTSINTSRKDSNSNRETLNRIVPAEHDIPKLRSGLPTRTAATNLEKP